MKPDTTLLPYEEKSPRRPKSPYDHLLLKWYQNVNPKEIFLLPEHSSQLFVGNAPVVCHQHSRQRPQAGETAITGKDIWEELMTGTKQHLVCGGEMIDKLLAEPEKFPAPWKMPCATDKVKFFFAMGTVYGAPSLCPNHNDLVIEFVRGVYWRKSSETLQEVLHVLDTPWYEDINILMLG